MKINVAKKGLFIFLNILLTISFLTACSSSDYISGEPKVYTHDDALKMFNDNRKESDKIAKILSSNDSFWQNTKDKETGTVADIYFTDGQVKQYFSQEE